MPCADAFCLSEINSSSCSPPTRVFFVSAEAARDTNEGNEGVINYPAGTLLHKSQNQWARQRPVCKHTHSISLSLSDGWERHGAA